MNEPADNRTPGQVAYDAYEAMINKQFNRVSEFAHGAHRRFSALNTGLCDSWEAAAQAVIVHHTVCNRKPPMVTEDDMVQAECTYDALAFRSDSATCDRDCLRAAIRAALGVMP